MRTFVKSLFLLPALLAVLNLIPAGRVTAQTFTTLHSFTGSDGANPYGGLTTNSSGNTLYGTAAEGGTSGNGTVFAVHTDGTGFTNLHSFTALLSRTNSDGAIPIATLILSGNGLYGTANRGGSSGHGTVFKVNTDGTGFTNLHSFTALSYYSTNSDGAYPQAGLILSGNTLYGAARSGGGPGAGTVFALHADGTGFTTLHSFTALDQVYNTNGDGAFPEAELILSGNTLYGTAAGGGASGHGTVFAVNTTGKGFTNLYSFTAAYFDTNSDGWGPSGLILSGNTLYGTAKNGGSSGHGTVFAVNTGGSGFTNLHTFAGSDGASPYAALVLSGNTLYGTAAGGGSSGHGTVFAVNTTGKGFTNLYSFTASSTNSSGVYTNSDGALPEAGLILSGNTLYGTAVVGGSSGNGTVFSLSFRPQPSLLPGSRQAGSFCRGRPMSPGSITLGTLCNPRPPSPARSPTCPPRRILTPLPSPARSSFSG